MESKIVQLISNLNIDLVSAIKNHAEPRFYDYAFLGATICSIFVSYVALKHNREVAQNQIAIMVQQKNISLYEIKFKIWKDLKLVEELMLYLVEGKYLDGYDIRAHLHVTSSKKLQSMIDGILASEFKLEDVFDLSKQQIEEINNMVEKLEKIIKSCIEEKSSDRAFMHLLRDTINYINDNLEKYIETLNIMKQQLKL